MKKIYSKLQAINSRITDCEKEIKAVKQLPFYSIFNREAKREKDLEALQELLNSLLHQKVETLHALTLQISQEKLAVTSLLQHH
ncbi:hypothetical protein DVK85_06770 [Flavobacterium arcticum]|uniref:Uncharacterized protein n=1 Tax=Flavobacterium arcticum TaxID=1784713 RepID=A0A345HBK3_9FLAO|nr:hypothetical protein [Flavobacterium arcticum]AXG73963.1 hypothetical protein DVK85_06770 [Flavobacterium arcticum]KAF2508939.1 hypothetical protein E0W72_10255 [Flavobacterium arcticum]